jgi:glucokinase
MARRRRTVSQRYAIGLDMGGTNIRTAAVSMEGKILMLQRGPSRADADAPAVMMNIARSLAALESAARARGMGAPRAIGVAVPGPLNVFDGTVMTAPHVGAWRRYPLRRKLEEKLERRIVVENDANAWTLGEFWRGAAHGCRNAVFLILGTGVGGGLIVNGEIVHGRSGMAAELGHICVEPDGPRCDCGSRGCLEAFASASGIRGLVERRLRARKPIPARYLDRDGNLSVRAMTIAARAGDRLAREVFAEAGRALGVAIGSLLNAMNPELVVIGGGVAGALSFMRPEMTLAMRAHSFAVIRREAKIVRAALGPSGGVVGATYAALHPAAR